VLEKAALEVRILEETAARRAAEELAHQAQAQESTSVLPERHMRPPCHRQEQQTVSIVGFKYPVGLVQDVIVITFRTHFVADVISLKSASLNDFANRDRETFSEFARHCCPQTNTGASYGEKLTDCTLPKHPRKRSDQLKMQELASTDKEHTKPSFVAFLQQAVGRNYLQFIIIYTKTMDQENRCLF
jgi:hypothetical protein